MRVQRALCWKRKNVIRVNKAKSIFRFEISHNFSSNSFEPNQQFVKARNFRPKFSAEEEVERKRFEEFLLNLIANSELTRGFLKLLYYVPLLHMTEDFFIKKLYFDKIWCLERNFYFNFLIHFEDETLSKKTKGIFFINRRKIKKTVL